MLEQRPAAAHSDHETAAAEVIEHADFLVKPQRMIERQHVNQRPKLDLSRALHGGGEEDARACRQPERRGVVLGQVIGRKTLALNELEQAQALFEEFAQRRAAAVEVIEYAEAEHALFSVTRVRNGANLSGKPS